MDRRGSIALAAAVLFTAAAPAARAEVGLHGFTEGAYGLRTAEDPRFDGIREYTLQEARAQVRLESYGDRGEAFVRLDFLEDRAAGAETKLEIRESFLRFTTAGDRLDVKVGRQALTWGTGDLVFVNDLFPKDWVSFFVGREDQYLKAPADAIRLGLFGLPFDADIVLAPTFAPDRVPDGSRLSFYAPPGVEGVPLLPGGGVGDGEAAVRLSKYAGSATLSLYGYQGFFKTPSGMDTGGSPYYPKLCVYGASVRGAGVGGVYWLEGGYYDSREDRNGSNPAVPNASVRFLAGYEKQLGADWNTTLQWYGEWMQDHEKYAAALPEEAREEKELRQVVTLRIEKMLLYQTLRLSFFAFYSPTDEDAYLRPMASYHVTDEVEIALGANVFEGRHAETSLGQFDRNDNLYTRLRYTF